jgi:hypothetical protein
VARRGYAVGSAVLAAVLPANQGPTATAPVAMDDAGPELADGIEAKQAILTQLDIANVARWGIHSFSPDDLREATQPVLAWLAGPAARGWPSISMSTPSTAPSSCWGLAPSRAG